MYVRLHGASWPMVRIANSTIVSMSNALKQLSNLAPEIGSL